MTNTGECSDEYRVGVNEAPDGSSPFGLSPLLQAEPRVPIILCGDHAEFEAQWAGKDPRDRPDWPLPSFDARDWAASFRKIAIDLGYSDMDEGWLIGWFANSLMRGYDEGCTRSACTSETHPKGGDASLAAPFMSGAVGEADLPNAFLAATETKE